MTVGRGRRSRPCLNWLSASFRTVATLLTRLVSVGAIVVLGCYCSNINAAEFMRSGEARVNSWTAEEGLPGNGVVAMAQDGGGYLWLATLNGPARFDGARFVRVRLWDGLASLLTQRLLSDNRGRL